MHTVLSKKVGTKDLDLRVTLESTVKQCYGPRRSQMCSSTTVHWITQILCCYNHTQRVWSGRNCDALKVHSMYSFACRKQTSPFIYFCLVANASHFGIVFYCRICYLSVPALHVNSVLSSYADEFSLSHPAAPETICKKEHDWFSAEYLNVHL